MSVYFENTTTAVSSPKIPSTEHPTSHSIGGCNCSYERARNRKEGQAFAGGAAESTFEQQLDSNKEYDWLFANQSGAQSRLSNKAVLPEIEDTETM